MSAVITIGYEDYVEGHGLCRIEKKFTRAYMDFMKELAVRVIVQELELQFVREHPLSSAAAEVKTRETNKQTNKTDE